MNKINQFEIWIADLNPRFETEPGKIRPVCIIQTNLLNQFHPSTIICPITTNIKFDAEILRVHIKKGRCGMKEDCDIMIDQMRSIDNKRLLKKVGSLPEKQVEKIKTNIKIIIDLQ